MSWSFVLRWQLCLYSTYTLAPVMASFPAGLFPYVFTTIRKMVGRWFNGCNVKLLKQLEQLEGLFDVPRALIVLAFWLS